jgi:hypothetical protein
VLINRYFNIAISTAQSTEVAEGKKSRKSMKGRIKYEGNQKVLKKERRDTNFSKMD